MTLSRPQPAALCALVLLAGCQAVPRPAAPPPPPPPAPTPTPTPAPPPTLSWEEAPVASGNWRYVPGGDLKAATFGRDGAAPQVTIACRASTRQIDLSVHAVPATPRNVTIRTSFGALAWMGAVDSAAGLRITRSASDPGFDWMAYSRGRVSIETEGGSRLIVPAWAEISRVIEECRN